MTTKTLTPILYMKKKQMNKLIVILMCMCFGCDIGQYAIILDHDGDKMVGRCDGINWPKCIRELCPDGYDIVGRDSGDGIILRCKSPQK
jgi:hypothetical protein